MKRLLIALLAALALGPALACTSTETKAKTQVDFERSDYPDEDDPIELAKVVKQRVELARKLWSQDRLDECIKVLEDLTKNVPQAVSPRYDLGMMYYQRASPKISRYRKLSNEVTELADRNKQNQAEDKAVEVGKAYEALAGDCAKALDQFLIFSQKVPQDPRPVDMMWRCQLALEQYAEAEASLTRMINWDGVLQQAQREAYDRVRKNLREYIRLKTRTRYRDNPDDILDQPRYDGPR